MESLLREVLDGIKPDVAQQRLVFSMIDSFLRKLNSGLRDAEAVLGGSGAKSTWLVDVHDADVFVCFDFKKFKDRSDQLSDILEKHLKKKFPKFKRLHGSRDYFQVKDKDFTFEVVPILRISKARQAVNITDVSPLHAGWVGKHKKFADEIRLTKQFCKANDLYGAESYIMGFSGYICEVLTIYYKGFLNLVKAASKWSPKVIVDVERHYKDKGDLLFHMNKSKLVSPLVVVDPVQSDRNAAAALSQDKFDGFVQACKDFLKSPSKDFFIVKRFDINNLKQDAGKNTLLLLDVKPLIGKEDVVGGKLKKSFDFLKANLLRSDFKVLDSGWWFDREKKSIFWFILDPRPLSEFVESQGPPLNNKVNVVQFKKKHKSTFIKDNRVCAKDKRKFRRPDHLVKDLIKDRYIKEKVKSIVLR